MLRKSFLYPTLLGISLLAAGSANANTVAVGDTMDVTLSKDASCILPNNEYASTLLLQPDPAELKNTATLTVGTTYTHTATISFNNNNVIPTACENLPITVTLTSGTIAKSDNITLGAVAINGSAPTTLGALKTENIVLALPITVSSDADLSEVYYQYPVNISIVAQ
jgi:hypothetical protein